MQLLLLAAQEASGGGEGQLVEAFKHNPTFMVLNLCASAVVLTIVVERFTFQLTRYRVNSKEFFAQIKKLVTAGNIDRAIKLCEASDYPILQLVKSGLTHSNKGPDEIDAALSEKLSELKPQAEKRVGALWSMANIVTLTGLLGTITGLIRTFSSIGNETADQRQRDLSNGISEAMYNTAFGLSIALLCMLAHLLLSAAMKKTVSDLEAFSLRFENLLAEGGAALVQGQQQQPAR